LLLLLTASLPTNDRRSQLTGSIGTRRKVRAVARARKHHNMQFFHYKYLRCHNGSTSVLMEMWAVVMNNIEHLQSRTM